MSYKIAVASSDEINVDETFGQAKRFLIYEADGNTYHLIEDRKDCIFAPESCIIEESCGAGGGCGMGSGCGTGGGCGGNGAVPEKISALFDCRAVVCKKIGTSAQKQFEKKAISYFDVSCTVKEALEKITFYFNRIDNHVSLRSPGR